MEVSKPMGNQNPYLTNLVLSASPTQLVGLLYDGLVRFLNCAMDGFSEQDPQKKNETIHNNLIKAQNILVELNASLNHEEGGEFATRMGDLYNFYIHSLGKINTTKDPTMLPRIIQLITELRDAWYQASNVSNAEAAAPEQSATATH